MSNEVQELLAKIGEKVVRGSVFKLDKHTDPETKQVIISIEDEPRKLILDPDGAINWYNSELPEVV
jgi:hypothetical protein